MALTQIKTQSLTHPIGGVMPSQTLKKMISEKQISSEIPVEDGQVQPASLDLRLGTKAYRVQAGFLPSHCKVMERVKDLLMHEVDLTHSGVLERGAVYIIPLMESLNLPETIKGTASPKSSTGRLDIFTRLLTDNGSNFDKVIKGYEGGLYLEVSPMTFSIIARAGDKLCQVRFSEGQTVYSDDSLQTICETSPLVYVAGQPVEADIMNGVWLSVDLKGLNGSDIVGYRARRHAPLIDLSKIGYYPMEEFWEPIYRPKSGHIILNPEDFYIMASRECLRVPAEYSSEMMAYETTAGELRVHYAGFFDPGFGCGVDGQGGQGTTGVLEIRSHDVPFVLEHGQKICRMVYERLSEVPEKIYSTAIGSNYAGQSLKLAKQFKG